MTSSISLTDARSFLFVPGNRPERFEKAALSGADVIVLDLEDAVPPAEKAAARQAIAQAWASLQASGTALVVRINAADQPSGDADLAWLERLPAPGPAGVMVPKVESAATLDRVRGRLPGVALLPLIESAAGWSAVASIAGCDGVARLVLGHIDFMADTGIQCGPDEAELAPLRFALAMATRARELAPAVDGVTVAFQDDDRLREDTRRALRFGFGAKLCIHPRQVGVVHEVMTPDAQQVTWARRVVEADATSGGAAVQLDGRMVDRPVVLQARRVLARHDACRPAP